jgi:hypothetical protein
MEIQVYQTTRYRNKLIYIRRLKLELFEFLIPDGDEIQMNHTNFNVGIFTKILYFVGLRKDIYSEEQLKNAIGLTRIAATTFIDEVLKEKPNDKRRGTTSEDNQAVAE